MLSLITGIRLFIVNFFTYMRRLRNRIHLKNKEFTLISSNCTGGIIYHELGIRFTSPFINLQMDSSEFIHMMLNLKEYMGKELEFFHHEQYNCPTARLGGGTVIFTHYNTEQQAKQKWDERRQRINYDNLYVMTNDRGVSEEDILNFEKIQCKNKVIFTSKQRNTPHALFLKDFQGKKGVAWSFERDSWTGSRYFERVFDYVGFLNSDGENVSKFLK